MQEFSLATFVSTLQDLFVNNPNMPKSTMYYMDSKGNLQLYSEKHKNREPLHLQQTIKESFESSTITNETMITFDLGNERMEITHPYYHILENTPYIRKRGQGTDKTRGSQAKIEPIKRDYEIISWNGKTFTKEYRKNVRGSRNRDETSTRRYGYVLVRRNGNSYKNDNYQYIEKIIDNVNPVLANMFGMRLRRTEKTGLEDDLAVERGVDISTIIDSFMND